MRERSPIVTFRPRVVETGSPISSSQIPADPLDDEKGSSLIMLQAYARFCRAQGMREATIRLRLVWLNCARRDVDLATATTDQLADWIATHGQWSPETRQSARNSFRSFYLWMQDTDRRVDDPSLKLRSVKIPQHLPRPVPTAVLRAALQRADDRDRVMLALAAFAGLRRGEIADLQWVHVEEDALRVTGKGGRQRRIPISPALADELAVHRAATGSGQWVFPNRSGSHLSPTTVGNRLKRALGGQWTAHTLRHRFATCAYAVQRDLLTVQRLLGHSKPETTARYAEPPADAALAAVLGAAA